MIVRFVKNIEQGILEAHFLKDDIVLEVKVLTQVEADALSEIIDFSKLPQNYSLQYIVKELGDLYFDNEGQETNFEIIVRSFA